MNNVQEISSNEFDALRLSLDKARLRKRLNDAKRVLTAEYRAMFKPGIFKHAERALYSDTPFGYRLQWQTRPQPNEPESYENQQTAIGTVHLIKLSPVAAENAVIDTRGCSRETARTYLRNPHASDCRVWVNEPCDCVTGKDAK